MFVFCVLEGFEDSIVFGVEGVGIKLPVRDEEFDGS